MADVTVIGRSTRIRGRISGSVDLEIQGHLDGEIAIDGDVTVDTTGLVAANIAARRLVVRGAVKGDLTGEDAVVLEDGARVVGDVRAPRIAITPGALVRGFVQTADAAGAGERPARAQAARPISKGAAAIRQPAAAAAVRTVPAAPRSAPSVQAAVSQRSHTPVAANARSNGTSTRGPQPSSSSRADQGPPPPVVPALKKGAKGSFAKKKG